MALTFSELAKLVSDETEAYKFIEKFRWTNGVVCPHCGTVGHAYLLEPKEGTRKTSTGKATFRRVWKCGACRAQFSVLVGTIFEDSKIPLSKWLLAIHELCADKNGISSMELSRKLGVTQKSAWFMAHRIRYAMTQPPLAQKLEGTIEADETYVGGLTKNMHKSKREKFPTRGRGSENKVPVVTLVERNGEARSKVMRQVTGANIKQMLLKEVDTNASIMTDKLNAYKVATAQDFPLHETVDHQSGEYVRGAVHTNSVENYFSQLKRSVDGTHHHVSEQHLNRYLAEFDFRYTNRKVKDGERTEQAIKRVAGKRLTYRQPVSK